MTRALRRRAARTLAAGLVAACVWVPASSRGETNPPPEAQRSKGAVTLDVLLLRPLGAAGLVVGSCLFLPAALLTSPGGATPLGEAYERFVRIPYAYVFSRGLGEF